MNILEQFKRGEASIVDLVNQINRTTARDGFRPEKERRESGEKDAPGRRTSDKNEQEQDSETDRVESAAVRA